MNKYKYKTAAYLRLSKGDGDSDGTSKGESNSISNQRLIIERFLQDNEDFELVETYVDDGYTGTNFDRPGVQKMLEDIDAGLIDCVIVKDLSRFGRERIETGMYILKEFESKGIRFIAINDNYDSLTAGSGDKHLVMPIKAMTNDFYSQDISNKVKASQSVKREKGEFMGAQAPFGYVKDPDNPNHLLVDPEAANIVRMIFAKRISGMSANEIAEHLKTTGVMTPSCYKEAHAPSYKNTSTKPGKSNWTAKQVLNVLKNETYLGSVVQGKTRRVSYKVNRRVNCASSILEEELMKITADLLKEKINHLTEMQELADAGRAKQNERLKAAEERLSCMNQSLDRLYQDQLGSYEAYRDGRTDKETYLKQKDLTEMMIEKLKENASLQEEAAAAIAAECAKAHWLDRSIELKAESLDKDLINLLIDRIIINADKTVEVIWKFNS